MKPRLAATVRAKGARLAVPNVPNLFDVAAEADGVAKIVIESVREVLLNLPLQIARSERRRTKTAA